MSAANVPEGLKNITPFLQRAAQLQERDPIVSYYANYYAAKLAIAKASKENRGFVEELLNVLEKQRKDIGENEAISNDLVGYAHIENFAIKIFSKADNEDREGQGSQKTAKNFVAAANFLEMLKVFGEIDSEIEEKIKYAKWRAADIVKAIRDGRQPAPPPDAQKSTGVDFGLDVTMSSLDAATDATNAAAETQSGGAMDTTGGYTNATTYSPAVAAPTFTPSNVSGSQGGPAFPTISNFPSPPVGHTNPINNFNGNAPQGTNNWTQQSPAAPTVLNSAYIPPASSPAPSNISHIQNHPAPQQPFVNPDLGGYAPAGPVNPTPMNQTPYGQQQPPQQPQHPSTFGSPSAPYTPQPSIPPQQPPHQPPQQPYYHPQSTPTPPPVPQPQQYQLPYNPLPIQVLDPAVSTQVQKHCKWTISSLTYDDIPAAIDNLEKALALLRPYQGHAAR